MIQYRVISYLRYIMAIRVVNISINKLKWLFSHILRVRVRLRLREMKYNSNSSKNRNKNSRQNKQQK